VLCEPRQGYPHETVMGPVLFDARIADVLLDGALHLIGFEVVGRAIHMQEWDCYFLDR
jgi:hypothetical protein